MIEDKLRNVQRARKKLNIKHPNIKTYQGYNSATNKSQIKDTKGSQTQLDQLVQDKINLNNSNKIISDSSKYLN